MGAGQFLGTVVPALPGGNAGPGQNAGASKDLQVIGVAVMYRARQDVTNVVKNKAISYPIVFGNEDIASDFGGVSGLPTSFLYSPSGKLVGQHQGPLTRQQLEQAMDGSTAAFKDQDY